MVRKLILISLMIMLAYVSHSQESFKKSLDIISSDLCSKMVDKGKKKIVVLFVTDINKAQTTIGKYIADVVSYNVVNHPSAFSVFDRENLSGISEAKKLINEGYIDANNAKHLGKILSVEAIIIGNYTLLSSTMSLTLKALDVNDGFVIAQSLKDLPLDRDATTLLGISPIDGSQNTTSNRGFNNRPLNSNESYNNPGTVSQECEKNDTGDYCFTNITKMTLNVYHSNKYGGFVEYLTLNPGETQCFYNLKSGSYSYVVTKKDGYVGYRNNWLYTGNILVERCKSKTFTIK